MLEAAMRWLAVLLFACGGSGPTDTCRTDDDCAAGVSCTRGTCARIVVGEPCQWSSQCKSSYCVNDRCTSGENGQPCNGDAYCASHACVKGVCAADMIGRECKEDSPYSSDSCSGVNLTCRNQLCQRRGARAATCEKTEHCLAGLSCVDRACRSDDDLKEAARKTAAAEETRMLQQSGVKPAAVVEKAAHPPGPGQRVRTAKAKGKGRVFAACRDDERLVGGGCSEQVASYPSETSAEDTVAARWNCVSSSIEVTAYALCQQVP
jgi:hypothetical protein